MELRSSGTASTKHDGKDRSIKVTAPTGSEFGSSGARNRGNRSASSTSLSSGRRRSPDKRQTTSKSLSSCSNNEHCSKNDKPLSQRDGSASHDSTNGQVMGYPGNSSASSVQSRQRDMLLYVFSLWHNEVTSPLRILDTSPTGHFVYWTVRLLDISPTTWTVHLQLILPTRLLV